MLSLLYDIYNHKFSQREIIRKAFQDGISSILIIGLVISIYIALKDTKKVFLNL